jgi:HKD family nuclease
MKFLDFTTLLDTEPANLAALSTYQFDADFFERRLLRCSALLKARRILVFMDASQWFNLLRQDVPARFLNRRYLVVPVRPPQGVFHPKLNLLVREDGGQVHCGSNNLTRSGCASNLELLNSFSITAEKENVEAVRLAQEAYAFFKRACDDADQETGRIARQWLEELPKDAPWLATELPPTENRAVRLVHTYEGSLWDRVASLLESDNPKHFLVISPFFDQEGELAQRIRQRWPKCQIEIVVQQKTTNLPIATLKKLRSGIALSELRNSSRRLHAKLLAWETSKGTGCVVGSANFTTAAFDARNVETCLLVSDAKEVVSGLFDGQLAKRPLAFDDFDAGTEQEPKAEDVDSTTLRLTSALLTDAGQIKVSYRHRLPTKPSSLRVAIRTPGEQRPRAFLNIPNKENGTATLTPPESALKDAHGTILASLVAEVGDKRDESPPIWVIQEGRLTYEPSGEGSSSAISKVEESGEGLTEFLEELGKRDGVSAVIEYLRHLNIRFNDGGGGLHGGRLFQPRIRDPFHSDVAPDWLLNAKDDTSNLAEAIYDFVDRHEKQRLRKHAKRGNINGMENFLDIFTALVRLLCVYHVRGFVHRLKLIGRLCNYIEIAICGFDNAQDSSEGFLYSVYDNLGDPDYLQEVCDELNFLGHIRAAFVIVQRVRYVAGETATWGTPPKQPSECLPDYSRRLREAIKDLNLKEPLKSDIMKALAEYRMFSEAGLAELEDQIVV